MRPGQRNSITDVDGVSVGHDHRLDPGVTADTASEVGSGWGTGCTVVLVPDGAVAAVDVRGGGPGTRETDLLDPSNTVQHAHAVLLSGGSAYGLAAADGVMRWLEAADKGISMGGPGRVVPIVPGAVIFDLPIGSWTNRPDGDFGFRAAQAAALSDGEFATGAVGAGTGARAGALKGGVGTASLVCEDGAAAGATVGALVVVNPVGSVFDPRTGLPWGVSSEMAGEFGLRAPDAAELGVANDLQAKGTVLNTTIGVVATDASLGKASCKRLAVAAHDGLARAVRPAHSPLDGDTFFALATGVWAPAVSGPDPSGPDPAGPDSSGPAAVALPAAFPAELALLDPLCAAAALCVERAIVHAILDAVPVAGIPSYREMFPSAWRQL